MSGAALVTPLPLRKLETGGGEWTCILDLPLALSKYGLVFALRLAEELDVWLVRTLWEILDNSDHFVTRPELLSFGGTGASVPAAGSPLARSLNQWHAARTQTDLSGLKVYWAGDATHESLMPNGVDRQVIQRFETLAATLERLFECRGQGAQEAAWALGMPLCDGARDAVALAAALVRFRPIIFTVQREDGSEPALCDYLGTCGVSCHRIEPEVFAFPMRNLLESVFTRCGVAELVWAGLRLAAVHIVAPRAFVIPYSTPEQRFFQDDLTYLANGADDWWEDAVALWYPLGRGTERST